MKLSELKNLNPEAYNVFIGETERLEGKRAIKSYVKSDYDLSECCFWDYTKQGNLIWSEIYFNQDFTLFNEWMENNKNNKI